MKLVFISCDKREITNLKSIKCPTSEFEEASLLIKWEELDVDLAGGLEDGGRVPHDLAVVVQNGLRHRSHDVVAVGTRKHQKATVGVCP